MKPISVVGGRIALFGLVMFAGLALVCCVALIAIVVGWKLGRRHGGSQRRGAGYATLGFLFIYLPLFYYQVPIWVTLRYSCWKDGGFRANVDPKEWNAQNLDRLKQLTQKELDDYVLVAGESGWESSLRYGGLILYSRRSTTVVGVGPGLYKLTEEWRDTSSRALIATRIRYGAESIDDIRAWFVPRACGNDLDARGERSRFLEKLINRG
jgi:hypothetical protein